MARNIGENGEENVNPAYISPNVKNALKPEILKDILQGSFQDNKTKLGNDALPLVVEIAKCLVTETCLRACNHALRDNSEKVDIEHIEKCLPQLMLDFP